MRALQLANPFWIQRRIRELGPRGLAVDFIVKRWNLIGIDTLGPLMRAAQIARHPLQYLQRKHVAASFADNPLAIPESKGYRVVSMSELPEAAPALAECQRVLAERRHVLDRFPGKYGINLMSAD